ncbi:MAG TPA: hypothetical protein VGK67_07970 [Myxococcales bacterium]|jgi:hypothetical protein
MTRAVSLLLVLALANGCASLERSTRTVRVVTEPEGASVSVTEPDGRKDLGPSPVEYKREVESYKCGMLAWLIPVGMAAVGAGAGFGVAYATTARNDKVNSGLAGLAIFAAAGMAVGIAVAAECRMKDGEAPEHKDVKVLVEATKEGFAPASAPLKLPSRIEELKLVLPPLGGAPAADTK